MSISRTRRGGGSECTSIGKGGGDWAHAEYREGGNAQV